MALPRKDLKEMAFNPTIGASLYQYTQNSCQRILRLSWERMCLPSIFIYGSGAFSSWPCLVTNYVHIRRWVLGERQHRAFLRWRRIAKDTSLYHHKARKHKPCAVIPCVTSSKFNGDKLALERRLFVKMQRSWGNFEGSKSDFSIMSVSWNNVQ